MTDTQLEEAIERAKALASKQDEPYRSIAFKVLLRHFLGASGDGQRQPVTRALAPQADGPQIPPSLGLNEFMASKNVQTHVERVVAIAYFFYNQGDHSGVTTRQIAEAYAKARLKKPQNIPDVIATCVRNGFLVDSDKKDGMKAWLITQTGERSIEEI